MLWQATKVAPRCGPGSGYGYLGHSNIKMTERYAKLAKDHIARTGTTARELWKLMEEGGGNGLLGRCDVPLLYPEVTFAVPGFF